MDSKVTEVSDSMWVVNDAKLAILFSNTDMQGSTGKINRLPVDDGSGRKIMYWGARNTLPQEREELIRNNGILGELIKTKRDFTISGGLVFFRRKWVDGKEIKEYVETPADIAAFLKKVNIRKVLRKIVKNLYHHGNYFVEFIRNKGGEIISLRVLECRHMRAVEQDNNGVIPGYYWCGKWHKPRDKDVELKYIPAYDPEAKKKQPKFVYHSGDDLIYDDYYYGPTWWGDQVVKMIQVANIIPEFHLSNINNGYSIRFWIEIPKNYFAGSTSRAQTPEEQKKAANAEKAAKTEFKKNIDAFLAGAANAGKAVFTEYDIVQSLGKEFPGIKIHTLDYDLKGDELLKLYAAALQTLTASQGIHPTLANVDTAGKLSSGSEMRNAHLVFLKTKTPEPRAIVLEFLDIVYEENGWDTSLECEFRDVEITKLDENKAGFQDSTTADTSTPAV